jgi:hypothetical protein
MKGIPLRRPWTASSEAENAEEPAFGKRQSAESAESDGSSTEPNAEIGKNSDESPAGGGGAGQEAAERPLKAFYSVELDSRSKKDACGIISGALDQAGMHSYLWPKKQPRLKK